MGGREEPTPTVMEGPEGKCTEHQGGAGRGQDPYQQPKAKPGRLQGTRGGAALGRMGEYLFSESGWTRHVSLWGLLGTEGVQPFP